MKIGDLTNSNLASSKHVKPQRVTPVGGEESHNTLGKDRQGPGQHPQDSLAISEEARRALEADQKRLLELREARAAYDALPRLSQERIDEIKQRIRSGFYTQPDTLDHVARKVARDLGGDE